MSHYWYKTRTSSRVVCMIYAQNRLTQIGFNPDLDWAYYTANPDEPIAGKVKKPTDWADEQGNLCIGVFGLDRQFITVDVKKSHSRLANQIFHFIRWAKPQIIDGEERKITPFEAGHGVFPYIPIEIVDKYQKKTKIKNLIITEGQIKAKCAARFGLDIVGIPGIQIWNAKDQASVFKDIEKIIIECSVETITFLTDADTLTVQWVEAKDLGKRAEAFCNAVTQFKERTRDFNLKQVFAHIKENSPSKGIDDLIIDNPKKVALIIKELDDETKSGTWFEKMEIGSKSSNKIREYFGLNEGVESFYNKYENIIGLREFVFHRSAYKFDEVSNKVRYEKCGESTQFIMVDSTFFIKGPVPTKYGEIENALKPIKPAGIAGMFKQKSKNFADDPSLKIFLKKLFFDIPYYNGFINRPAHIDFKKDFLATDKEGHSMKYFNKYLQLSHNPMPGNTTISIDFVKHIFGSGTVAHHGKIYNEWELGLDYLQILYLEPTQFLPIVCLVSSERGTGKTKFWEWIAAIFQANVKPINSHQLNGQFTSLFASALLVYIDEAFLDKKETIEKLKSLVTSDKGRIEYKGIDADIIDNYLKVGIATNDKTSFANIPGEEVRFWVRELSTIPEDKIDKYWFDNLRKEIPAFLHFLQNRKMVTHYEHRQWFHPNLIRTDALDAVVSESRSGIEITIEHVLKEHMSNVNKAIVYLSTKDIRDMIDENKIALTSIRWGLEQKMKLKNSGWSKEYEKYSIEYSEIAGSVVNVSTKKSIFYTFTASSIFNASEILDLFSVEQINEMEKKEIEIFGYSLFWKKFSTRNKSVLKQLPVFKERDNESLDTLIIECSTFVEAYNICIDLLNSSK
ncbi:MAG: DUF3854 domain-containing protein [Saprospiraceae bacterium]|nr:DUF3854 domain-containing protein [Saprospiraceae bacterium]